MLNTLRTTRFMVGVALHTQGEIRVFNLLKVGEFLRLTRDEAEQVARELEREGMLSRLPNGEAVLTSKGAAEAHQIIGHGHDGAASFGRVGH